MTRPVFYLTIIILLLNISVSSGQTKTEIKEMFYEAEAFVLYEEWQEALPGYLELMRLFPDNYNYKYRAGMCYLNIPGQKDKALGYLQEAVQNINPKYKEGRLKEIGAPYDALYYLASAYQITNQLDKAIETYREFYNGMDIKMYDTTIVKFQIETCYNAKKLMEIPLYLKEVNQGDMINENFSEFNPVVSADESVMVFSKKLQFYTAPFFTRKINGQWTPPVQLIEQLLIDEGISTSLSSDGTQLYLYKSDNYDGNIYVSNYADGRWSPAVKMNDNINTNYWESHAVISSDGQALYFTSNRKGGYGGLDIYVSKKDSLGMWAPAVNLGPTINTPFNEETPFLDKTDKTLFFSSRGHYNMGGHDIFYSTRLKNGEWSQPVNMGYPVNTTDDDLFFSPVGEGYIAYMSKFDDHGYGQQDIFRLEVFSDDHPRRFFVRGMVTLRDLMSRFKDSVKISALSKLNMDTLLVIYSDPETGEYEFEVPHGEFRLLFESPGSENRIEDLDLALTRSGDSLLIPEKVLSKTDFMADLDISDIDSTRKYQTGDSALIDLFIEPSSILVVEHWVGDSLVSTEEYIVNDNQFRYAMIPETGDNRFVFTSQDRFNNTNQKQVNIIIPEPKVAPEKIISVDPDKLIALNEQTEQQIDEASGKPDPSIDSMTQAISQATGDNAAMQNALEKTSEKKIKNAGEWLETLYSVAIEDGTDKETLLRIIAAMSANTGMTGEEYLKALKQYAEGNLKEFIKSIADEAGDLTTPEEVISYLITNAQRGGYTTLELFETLARMIADQSKSADEILDYIDTGKRNYLWILWILIGGSAATFFIIFYKRRKKEEKRS